mgnify:CR=1 FL=1
MKKDLVIFDLDGTLLNTLEDLTNSTNFALNSFNYPKRTISEVRNFVGNGVYKLIERAIPEGKNNPNFNQCLKIFKNHYEENMYNKTVPYPGITNLLSELKLRGIKTAVVSNKFDLAVKGLCLKYFPSLIDFSAGEDEKNGIKKKPASDMVLSVLEEFNCSKNKAIYIGDSEVDIQTAQNSGLDSISVTWGFKNRNFLIGNGAKIIIDSPDEIIKYL